MRDACAATLLTASSLVKNETRKLPNNKNTTLTIAIKITLNRMVFITDSSARSSCLAPRFCPTNVAAALLRPHAGKIKNIISLMAV